MQGDGNVHERRIKFADITKTTKTFFCKRGKKKVNNVEYIYFDVVASRCVYSTNAKIQKKNSLYDVPKPPVHDYINTIVFLLSPYSAKDREKNKTILYAKL